MIELLLKLPEPAGQTVVMVIFSTILAVVLGFPLGVMLYVTVPGGLSSRPLLYKIMSRVVNVLRSFPFIILMAALFPLSRVIVGKSIGTVAAIVPLSVAAAPFVARLVESALREVDLGAVQAAKVMGSNNFQIIFKVIVPEAMASLAAGATLTVINIIGYSAMAGVIGGGGLGDLAIRHGFYKYENDVLLASIIVILIMVELVQLTGNKIVDAINYRR